MRSALYVAPTGVTSDVGVLCELAVRAEAAGWDGLFVWDHLVVKSRLVDSWLALAAVARETSRLVLGTMITPLPRRRPWKLALEVSTLAQMAPGRVTLGVGAGAVPDFARFGEPASGPERASRLEEGLALLRELLSGEPVTFAGEHYRVDDVTLHDAVQVPIWVGGNWPRRAPFHGARHADGLFPVLQEGRPARFRPLTPAEIAACGAHFVASGGRPDPDVAVWSRGLEGRLDAELAAAYDAAGATWWLQDVLHLSVEELRRLADGGPPAK